MDLLLKLVLDFPNAEALLLLGPILAVPIGLRLAAPARPLRGRWRFTARVQPLAAICLVASFALPTGPLAAALAAPWLAFTALLALLGVLRFVERGPAPVEELAIDAALVFPVIGATWLLVSRLGVPFMGFGGPIVLFTAAHFHFAGFALPLLTGLAGRMLPGRHAAVASIGVIVGVPFVAAGITLAAKGYGDVELAAASWLVLAALASALLQARVALASARGWTRAVLFASAVCLVGGMSLAGLYGARSRLSMAWPDVATMVRLHATANVLGYALLGLVAWLCMPSTSPRPRGFDVLVTWMGDEPDLAAWEARPIAAMSEAGPPPGNRPDAYEDTLGPEPSGPPAPKGPYEHAAAIIHRYDVFPPTLVDRALRRTPVEVGDTLGISYGLVAGVRVFFASRVTRCFDERFDGGSRTGFTYRTVEGHPYAGEETFTVEKASATGEVRISIRCWSHALAFVARVSFPLMRRLMAQGGTAGIAWLKQGSQW